jgi:hypothetical protein
VVRKQPSKELVKATTKEALDRIAEAEADEIVWARKIVDENDTIDFGFQLKYRISRTNKTLVLQNPEKLSEGGLRVLHEMVVNKFSKIGWKVSDGKV